MEGLWILTGLLWWVIPIAIIALIVRAIVNHGHKDQTPKKAASYRDFLLFVIALSAGYSGVAALYYLPLAVFGSDTDNAVFTSRLVMGVGLLVLGLYLRHVTGAFLMVMGILGFILAVPFVFESLGSAGALVVAALAFAVLVGFAVKVSRKAHHSG